LCFGYGEAGGYGFPSQSQVGGLVGAENGSPSQQIATVQPSHASPGRSGGLMRLLRVKVATSTFHAATIFARAAWTSCKKRKRVVSFLSVLSLCLSRACLGKMIICSQKWHRK
jgi:hypothetical protein